MLNFSYDAEAALKYLQNRKKINKSKIRLVGNSVGGPIAAMIAARSKDVAFVVLPAAPVLEVTAFCCCKRRLGCDSLKDRTPYEPRILQAIEKATFYSLKNLLFVTYSNKINNDNI